MTGTGWTVETVSAVDAEIEALPVALRARTVAKLTRVEFTRRLGTTPSAVARLTVGLVRDDGQGTRPRSSSPD